MGIALVGLLALTSPAQADVAPLCVEGETCSISEDEDGVCDANGNCVAPSSTSDGGCSVTGSRAAALGVVLGSIGLLAVGRRS